MTPHQILRPLASVRIQPEQSTYILQSQRLPKRYKRWLMNLLVCPNHIHIRLFLFSYSSPSSISRQHAATFQVARLVTFVSATSFDSDYPFKFYSFKICYDSLQYNTRVQLFTFPTQVVYPVGSFQVLNLPYPVLVVSSPHALSFRAGGLLFRLLSTYFNDWQFLILAVCFYYLVNNLLYDSTD